MTAKPWTAPTAHGPVVGSVTVPGSKSLASRALVIAALADGPSVITGLPRGARDIELMIAALRAMGTVTADLSDGGLSVQPAAKLSGGTVDCGLAGTVMRFVPAVAALAAGDVEFDGDPRARERPMAATLAALRQLGVEIDDGGTGRLPFTVHATGAVRGGAVDIDASRSSQFVSSLLLAGARFEEGVTLHHRGDPVPSLPHIVMTTQLLAEHGVHVQSDMADRTDSWWRVEPGTIAAHDRAIEPDLSNATPLMAAALVTGGGVVVRDWPAHSHQPASPVLEVLAHLGIDIEWSPEGLLVRAPTGIRGITADMRDLGELVPTVTALCALAQGDSLITGISHIAGHETDRLTALADEINALGGDVSRVDDGLAIRPRPLHGGLWHTYADHRMATAGAIIGLVVPGVHIDDIACTDKTFPDFPGVWNSLVTGGAA